MISLPVAVATALRATADWARVSATDLVAEAIEDGRRGGGPRVLVAAPLDLSVDQWRAVKVDPDRGSPMALINASLMPDQRAWIQQQSERTGVGAGVVLAPYLDRVLSSWLPGFVEAPTRTRYSIQIRVPSVFRTTAEQALCALFLADTSSGAAAARIELVALGADPIHIGARLLLSGEVCSPALVSLVVAGLLGVGACERLVYLLERLEASGLLQCQRESASGIPQLFS